MRLLLTRPKDQCKPLKKELERQGHQVFCLPLIEIHPPKDKGAALKKALRNLQQYHWLLLTSQNTVRAVAKVVKKLPKNLQIVAAGSKTAALGRQMGWQVSYPKEGEGVEGILKFLAGKKVKGKRFLYPRSDIGRKKLATVLKKRGAKVTEVVAYQTKPATMTSRQIHTLFQKEIDAVLFFSPSAERVFLQSLRNYFDRPFPRNFSAS